VEILSPDGWGPTVRGRTGRARATGDVDDTVWAEPARRLWVERRARRRRDFATYRGEPHAHLVVGNVPRADLERELDRWPGSWDLTNSGRASHDALGEHLPDNVFLPLSLMAELPRGPRCYRPSATAAAPR